MRLLAREVTSMREQLEQLTRAQTSLQAVVSLFHTEFTASMGTAPAANSYGPIDFLGHGPPAAAAQSQPPVVPLSASSMSSTSPPVNSSGPANSLGMYGHGSPAAAASSRPAVTKSASSVSSTDCIVPSTSQTNVNVNDSLAKNELEKILNISNMERELELKQAASRTRLGNIRAKVLSTELMKPIANNYELSHLGEDDWLDKQKVGMLDSAVALVILLNAVVSSLSMDVKDPNNVGWLAIGCIFATLFWAELVIKVWMFGCRELYCGKGALSNLFDAGLILTDTVQLMIMLFASETRSGVYITVFRIIRLLRLVRLLRVFQAPIFKDLMSMVHGMVGGMTTLAWSVVFLVVFIWMISVIFRVSLGPGEDAVVTDEDVEWYFENLSRSMYTVFRCSFGDCSTTHGTPLFEKIADQAGAFKGVVFCSFFFVMLIGMFNVISAIFVESTLAAAAEQKSRKLRTRLNNDQLWAVNTVRILQKLLITQDNDVETMTAEDLKDVEFSRALIENAVKEDAIVQDALTELDIDPHDHDYLSDILDPDNSGTVGALELVEGLQRLRGQQRRSDIVAIDLMVRSLQAKVDDIWLTVHLGGTGTQGPYANSDYVGYSL